MILALYIKHIGKKPLPWLSREVLDILGDYPSKLFPETWHIITSKFNDFTEDLGKSLSIRFVINIPGSIGVKL